jgi:streptomycin 6-kinase
MPLIIPERLAETCARSPARLAWLAGLPAVVRDLERRWSVDLGVPFDRDEVSCAWVAPATRADGSAAVLKIGMPHLEGEHELDGLRFWNGNPTVRLLDAAADRGAMLLERCEPGTHLRTLPEDEQDPVIAGILRRLWRLPAASHPFRPLSAVIECWAHETFAHADDWPDADLVRDGLRLFDELAAPSSGDMLLGTDVHAGNVLRAEREPWLLIDPKPFLGDPAYDATQHLLNCTTRLQSDPRAFIQRFADLLEVDWERVRLWTFARAAAEPRDEWTDPTMLTLARRLACA